MNSQDHSDKFTVEQHIPDDEYIDDHPDAHSGKQIDLPPIEFITDTDLAQIPKTQYLYRKFIVRGTTSLTVAAPKVGKSLFALAEAIDMASGGKVFGNETEQRRCLYYNPEDSDDVLMNRVAAICTHCDIKLKDLEGWLAVKSGVQYPDFFLIDQGPNKATVMPNAAAITHLENSIKRLKLDVVILDPLQDLSHAEESNEAFRALGQILRVMASTLKVGFHIVHHTRKVAPGMTPSIDDARGGSALRGTCRFNRVLVAMTAKEATEAGVDDCRYFFRIGELESNMAPPSSDANQWYEKVSVLCPNGEYVAALKTWEWPDAFEGVGPKMAAEVREAIKTSETPVRANMQANDWGGYLVMQVCRFPITSDDTEKEVAHKKERAKHLIKTWKQSEVLKVGEVEDKAKGKTHPVLLAGPNNPMIVRDA